MAFIDHITIHAVAGKGGDGVVRWLHLKGKDHGGPAGGDGGRGGDIVCEGVRDIAALAFYRHTKEVLAENGASGENNNKHGKNGEPVKLIIPVGSVVTRTDTGESVEILNEGEQIVILKGGAGGYGNAHYKSSVNRNPEQASKGKKGEAVDIEITLKLIADAGLIGFPNAGKSSLLNELTRSHSKVGAYAFTTLDPHLGSFHGYVLADIPGLVEGSATGKGLGIKFLQHIERTKILIHLVSAERDDVTAAYVAVRNELAGYSRGLENKKEIILLTKTDLLPDKAEVERKKRELEEVSGGLVTPVSILEGESLETVARVISGALA